MSTISEFVYSRITQVAISKQIIFNMLRLFSLAFEIVINLYSGVTKRPILWSLGPWLYGETRVKRIFYEYSGITA